MIGGGREGGREAAWEGERAGGVRERGRAAGGTHVGRHGDKRGGWGCPGTSQHIVGMSISDTRVFISRCRLKKKRNTPMGTSGRAIQQR